MLFYIGDKECIPRHNIGGWLNCWIFTIGLSTRRDLTMLFLMHCLEYMMMILKLNLLAKKSTWLQEVQDLVLRDSFYHNLESKLQQGKLDTAKYKKVDVVFFYKNKILLPPQNTLKHQFLFEHHNTHKAGHSRYEKTYQRIKKVLFWQGLKKDVKSYVKSCDVCQRMKYMT